jgi:hypothetical protein
MMITRLNYYTYVLLFILCSALSGCGIFQSKPNYLLTNTSEQTTVVSQQQWQLYYQNNIYTLQVINERYPDHWQWIMVNNLGQRLVTITGKNGTINIERQLSHPALDVLPTLLEAWQLSYWPLTDLQQQLPKGWIIEQTAKHREARFSGILRASIEYHTENPWQGTLTYNNPKQRLRLTIESQQLN